jgi:hypothetical protein
MSGTDAPSAGQPSHPDPSASVELTNYATNELTYTVRSRRGWRGGLQRDLVRTGLACHHRQRPTGAEHVRADLRPACHGRARGEHTVVFKIASKPFNTSRPVAIGIQQCLGAVVSDGCAWFWEWRSRKEEEQP